MKAQSFFTTLALALSLCLTGCDFDGGVEQGRCVAFNADAKTLTLVEDTSLDQHKPHYSGKVFTFKLPVDPIDMGPEPVAGDLLQIEPAAKKVWIYDPQTKSVRELSMDMDVVQGVNAKDSRLKGKAFPIIDRENNTITVYSPRLEELITLKPTPEQMALPPDTWKLGEEVRVAFRKENKDQAIRVMNVTQTNIFAR